MTDLYIIAAGKGSRMGGSVPKALLPISNGIPNITTTLQQAYSQFGNIFIVGNTAVSDQWDNYYLTEKERFPYLFASNQNLNAKVKFLFISSGLGDGHAVMQALEQSKKYRGISDDVVICWGDAFIEHSGTFSELLQVVRQKKRKSSRLSGVAPAVMEENPYVTLLVNSDMQCMSADFSKYGENHQNGFHDQSVFYFKKDVLEYALSNLHLSYWKNGRYITQGGELSLLYVFHYFYNTGNPCEVYETQYPTLGFNTPDEVASIQREIEIKWRNQSSLH